MKECYWDIDVFQAGYDEVEERRSFAWRIPYVLNYLRNPQESKEQKEQCRPEHYVEHYKQSNKYSQIYNVGLEC